MTNVVETHESFFARLDPWMSPKQLMLVKIAYQLAKSGHRYQTRKQCDADGIPIRYFNHPRSVAIYTIDELKARDARPIVTALLHDTLEDTRIPVEMIEHLFGEQIASDVKLLTKLPKEGYYSRLESHGNLNVWMVKIADRIDNLRDMKDLKPEFVRKQVTETIDKIFPLVRLCERNASNEWEKHQAYTLHNAIQLEVNLLKG